MSSRWSRVARGTLGASFSTFVAAFSHAAAGGGAPSGAALSLALAFSTIACVLLAGRGLSLWRIAASVAVSQLAFHTLFSLVGSGTSAARSGSAGNVGAHSAHDMGAILIPGASQASTGIPLDLSMVSGHVIAAVVTLAALVWGERAARGILTATLHLSRIVALELPVPVIPARPVRPGSVLRVAVPLRLELLFCTLRHRGPPSLGLLAF